jgi:hypothetical protein
MAFLSCRAPNSDIMIVGSEFDNCGHYCLSLVAAVNSHISYNKAVDCSMGSEADDGGRRNVGEVWDHNYVGQVHGSGWIQTEGFTFLSCGSAADFNYSGNISEYNTIDGAESYQSASSQTYSCRTSASSCAARRKTSRLRSG